MLRILMALTLTGLTTGCASTAATFFNRPVVEDGVKDVISTVSLSADRRTIVVVTEGANRGKFCAEPPPDTATGLKAELSAALKAKAEAEKKAITGEIDADFKDQVTTEVTVLAERTAPLDGFRTGVYALCQLYINNGISPTDVRPLFEKLIDSFNENVKITQNK